MGTSQRQSWDLSPDHLGPIAGSCHHPKSLSVILLKSVLKERWGRATLQETSAGRRQKAKLGAPVFSSMHHKAKQSSKNRTNFLRWMRLSRRVESPRPGLDIVNGYSKGA